MQPVVTPEEMAAIDAAASVPVEVLIERAGAATARAAIGLLGGAYGRHVVVVAGKGNNGNDGRACAARLRRHGVRVTVIDAAAAPERLPRSDLVIDAAYGTGFRGEYHAPDPAGAPVLAVDIPSGVAGLTGQVAGRPHTAARTVTFAALKTGLLFHPGRALAGEVVLADIGLDTSRARAWVVEAADVGGWLPDRPVEAHKWQASVLLVAGSPGMTGAAHLAAASAQRAGAGLVRVASPGVGHDPGLPTEAVGLPLDATTEWDAGLGESFERVQVVVIGPGLGRGEATTAAVHRLVGASHGHDLLVDGDGLAALGERTAAALGNRARPAVLTPHDGEFQRLAGKAPGGDRMGAARELAASTGAIVLLKGPTTVVAHPDGRVRVVTTGDQRLATAGTGDVLAGAIGALLARGLDPFDAAAGGAWLHGVAGQHGPAEGLIARDVVNGLPAAMEQARAARAGGGR
jgi:NAD(P)H-hydrate epimerase